MELQALDKDRPEYDGNGIWGSQSSNERAHSSIMIEMGLKGEVNAVTKSTFFRTTMRLLLLLWL
jgi:hypothetical protein